MINEFFAAIAVPHNVLATALLSYPFVTSLLWSVSGLYYLVRRRNASYTRIGQLADYSVVIPFHAEPGSALATAFSLQSVTPHPKEIVIVDDGSPISIAHDTVLPQRTRLVRLPQNRGKAGALQYVLPSLSTEVIVCMDADTKSESDDWTGMLANFDDPKVGGVTGKIRPAAGGGLVEWFQGLDYLTVIAVIKSAESAWGGLLTVSGAFVAYRAKALRDVGGWNTSSSAEDIDVSWRLQTTGWRLAFDSDWISRVEMAPTVKSLWCQRRRWSAGLGRALRDHGANAISSGSQHLPIVVLTLVGLIWLLSMLASSAFLFILLLGQFDLEVSIRSTNFGLLLLVGLTAFYAQLATAMAIDGRSILTHWRSIILAPLYPLYFWCILLTSFLAGFPKGFARFDNGTWHRTVRRIELKEAV